MNVSEKQMFERFVNILTEIETNKQDLKQFKDDVTFHKDHNPSGFDKETIKVIQKAAALEVAQKFEEFSGEASAVVQKYKELTNYDD